MHVRWISAWPFLRMEPSERDVKVQQALKNFEKVERRAHDEHLDELQDDITDLTDTARRIGNGSNGRA